jgi:hypothetical protein
VIIIRNKKLLLSLSVFFIAFLFTGCFLPNVPQTIDEALLTSIVVLPSNMNIAISDSETITSVTAYYDNDTSADIDLIACTYVSSSTSVTVTNGVITVSSSCTAGTTATIIVSYTEGGVTKSDTVIVTVPASGG